MRKVFISAKIIFNLSSAFLKADGSGPSAPIRHQHQPPLIAVEEIPSPSKAEVACFGQVRTRPDRNSGGHGRQDGRLAWAWSQIGWSC